MNFKEYLAKVKINFSTLYEYIEAAKTNRWKDICNSMRAGNTVHVIAADGKEFLFTGTNFKNDDVFAVLSVLKTGGYIFGATKDMCIGFSVIPVRL